MFTRFPRFCEVHSSKTDTQAAMKALPGYIDRLDRAGRQGAHAWSTGVQPAKVLTGARGGDYIDMNARRVVPFCLVSVLGFCCCKQGSNHHNERQAAIGEARQRAVTR